MVNRDEYVQSPTVHSLFLAGFVKCQRQFSAGRERPLRDNHSAIPAPDADAYGRVTTSERT